MSDPATSCYDVIFFLLLFLHTSLSSGFEGSFSQLPKPNFQTRHHVTLQNTCPRSQQRYDIRSQARGLWHSSSVQGMFKALYKAIGPGSVGLQIFKLLFRRCPILPIYKQLFPWNNFNFLLSTATKVVTDYIVIPSTVTQELYFEPRKCYLPNIY